VILCLPFLSGKGSAMVDMSIGDFGDWRLQKRGGQALERMCVRISAGVRELADNRAEKVGLTRFFRNPRVTVDEILHTAAERTGAAAAGRHVLLIEDTSEINYQAKAQRKRGLGRVGNGKDVGLFVHPALAIDAEGGAVLGLAGATIWRRTRVKEDDYQSLPIEEKESHRWIATALKARTFLSTAALVTLIADREGDIYELFARVPDQQTHVLVRAVRDRALADVGGRMLAKIAAQPEAGRLAFDLTGRPGRMARRVTLAVRFCPVTLRQPQRGADRRDPPQLSLNLVEAREIDPPPGEDPIVWRLLTTHAATSLVEATRIIDLYRCRWIVDIDQAWRLSRLRDGGGGAVGGFGRQAAPGRRRGADRLQRRDRLGIGAHEDRAFRAGADVAAG
jgi:hypothetical protein